MRAPEEIDRVRSPFFIEVDVEIVEGSFDPAIDGPSNAEVLRAGICTRRALLALVVIELVWMTAQLCGRGLLGACFDPPPFVILHRANLVLALALLTLALRARNDARERERARLFRHQLRLARAEAVRTAIADALARRLPPRDGSLH